MKPIALIAEPSAGILGALRKAAEAAGCDVKTVSSVNEAMGAMESSPPTLLIASEIGLAGEDLCRQARELVPECPVVLVYPPDADAPDVRSSQAGADACLVGPLKQGAVVSCLRSMLRMRDLKETVARLENDLKSKTVGPSLAGTRGTGTSEFDFFKKTLLMEIKRSRRYRYPVAFLLVGVDHFREKVSTLEGNLQHTLMAGALTVISEGIRDIDLAVPFSDGRFLVFLPHTSRSGAGVVASRLCERLGKRMDGLTASVGVAAYEPTKAPQGAGQNQPQVSFGSLMKEATEALSKAQLAGGSQVELGQGKAKRSRISLG